MSQTTTQPPHSKPVEDTTQFATLPKKNRLLLVYGVGIVILFLLFARTYGFFMDKKNGKESLESDFTAISPPPNDQGSTTGLTPLLETTQRIQKVVPVESSYKAYVDVVEEGALLVVPLDTAVAPYVVTKYGSLYSGGALGFGETGPKLSPDLEKFAFVRANKLVVVSADLETEYTVPLDNVTYITGWAPDGAKVIVYVTSGTVRSKLESNGPGVEIPIEFPINQNESPTGFYLIDFVAGSIRHMHELQDMQVYSWVDSSALVIATGFSHPEQFLYYNLATRTVNRDTVKKFNEVFGHQMSFSADGSKWSTVTSVEPNSTDMAQITMGNFPNFGDIARIEVPWARKQGPVMSPSGDKVAIWGSLGDASDGEVHIYRGTTIDYVAKGRPRLWLDNDRLLYINEDIVYTHNFVTGETKQLN